MHAGISVAVFVTVRSNVDLSIRNLAYYTLQIPVKKNNGALYKEMKIGPARWLSKHGNLSSNSETHVKAGKRGPASQSCSPTPTGTSGPQAPCAWRLGGQKRVTDAPELEL